MIAELNMNILEEIEVLKKDTKEAFLKLAEAIDDTVVSSNTELKEKIKDEVSKVQYVKKIDDMIHTQNEIKQELFIMRNYKESCNTTENRKPTTENSKPKSFASAVAKENERIPSKKHESKRKDTNEKKFHERNPSRSKDSYPRRHYSQRYQRSHESRSVNRWPQYYQPRLPRSMNSPYIPYRYQREGFGLVETEKGSQYMPPRYRRTDDRLYSYPRQRNHRQQYENLPYRPYNYSYDDHYRHPQVDRYFEIPVSNRFSVLGN